MAFFFLFFTIFIMFFQPVEIWPDLAAYQPLRNSAILALLAYLFSKKDSKHRFFDSKTNIYFVLFVAFQVISTATKWAGGAVEILNNWFKMGIVYYLITQVVNTEKRVKWISFAVVAAISYLSYFSISQFVLNYQPGMRAGGFGWYSNSNDLAIILVSVIPLILLLSNLSKSFILRYFYMALAGVFAFNLLFTGSRNGLLGLIAVFILSLIFSRNISKMVRVALIILMAAGVFTVGLKSVLSRSDLSGLSGDSSSEDRLQQWQTCIRMVIANPALGVGPDNFIDYEGDYGGIRGLEPHNTILQVFAETGVLGGLAFAFFSFYPLYFTCLYYKKRTKNSELERRFMIYQIVSVSLVGFWVCAFFSNRYQFYILYVAVALLEAVRTNILTEKQISNE